MGRRSTVATLPRELVEACNGLIREGHTIDAILAALQGLGAEVSRSAVGRYVKSARQALDKYRQAQEVAKVWVDKVEAEPNGDVGRLLPEMLRAVAYQTLATMGESDEPVDAKDVMLLSKALKDIAGATKTGLDTERQLRAMRADVKAAAADVEGQARAAGVSEDTIAQIRQRILGVGGA